MVDNLLHLFFGQLMQLNFICPTNREIESKGVYYYMYFLAEKTQLY